MVATVFALGLLSLGVHKSAQRVTLGKQPDGSHIVSTGQTLVPAPITFDGRPADFALHPRHDLLAVMTNREVFLVSRSGVMARTACPLPAGSGAGFRGVVWVDSGSDKNWRGELARFVCSTDQGYLQEYVFDDHQIVAGQKVWLTPEDKPSQVWPGGMCISPDGKKLYVAVAELGEVQEIDLATHKRTRSFPVQMLPFECRLSADGKTLVASNWAGRNPKPGDHTGQTGAKQIVIDDRGAPASGTLSLVDLASGLTKHVDVGLHPNALLVDGGSVYVANGMSDSVTEVDIATAKVKREIKILFKGQKVLGALPNALAKRGNDLLVCDGGDNALAVIDLPTGKVKGFLPAGYFPCSVELSHDGKTAYVLNSKGNGSVANTNVGNPGNPHDFQGTVSPIALDQDMAAATKVVAKNNHWDRDAAAMVKGLPVYNGQVKHVLYIIKENQTYDSIYGDLGYGNGDPKLCVLGEKVMPNHRKIAREFTLFDNGYVTGTNSADGHSWSTQAFCNDYMEHEYVGYRTYPDDGDCAMSLSAAGAIWDAVLKKGKKVRVYGEFCDDALATFEPREPKDWFEAWEDRQSGRNTFKYHCETRVPSLKPYICRDLHYWPIIESDNHRADVFLKEYSEFSKKDQVPDLMMLTLTNDHGSGMDPKFPTYPAMAADNDLALGRVVDAVSHSPQWKDTCIFVIEDDGQALPDHVDGHRTVYQVVSPWVKRKGLDSTLYTTVDMIKSIEMMLGLDPMNRFDWLARPITTCWLSKPDLTPYTHCENNQRLDEPNPGREGLDTLGKAMYDLSASLDWSHLDAPDPDKWSRVNWYAVTKGRPFPEQHAMARDAD